MYPKLLGLFLVCFSFSAFSQETIDTKKYAIEIAGIKVGEMIAQKEQLSDELVNYLIKSDVKVNLLVYTLKIKYEVRSQFVKSVLVYSKATANSNKGDFLTITTFKNGQYVVKSKQEKKEFDKIIYSPIHWSSSKLFFEEPTEIPKFYAEYYALFNQLQKNKDGSFSSEIGKNMDRYIYKNQKLIKVIKKNPIKNIDLILISEKKTI